VAPALLDRCTMEVRTAAVAGCGLAGLAAAHELAAAGVHVTILEARDRIGGRVWTVRHRFAAGQHGELGGEFIDKGQRRIQRLAKQYGLDVVRVLDSGFAQRLQPPGEPPRLLRTGGWDRLAEAVAPLVKRYKAAGSDPSSAAAREISTFSLREWLRHVDAASDVHAAADALRGFFIADPAEMSVLQLVQQFADGGSPVRTELYRIAGGNDRLLEAMAAAPGIEVLTGRVVRRVAQSADGVSVQLEDAGRRTAVEADAIVVALPAACTARLEFDPPLPDAQRHAVASVKYGCATKALVQQEGPGLSARRARAFATDGRSGAFWDSTEGQPSDSHSMLTFLAGGSASAALRQLAADGPAALLSSICWLRAGTPRRASGCEWVSWEQEEYSTGGYAYLDPAFDPAWLPLVGRRLARVVFAGEHLSDDWQGYMEGAIASGFDAARTLLREQQ
jgi:monoamine oxidase